MKITERKLRSIIRSVIAENSHMSGTDHDDDHDDRGPFADYVHDDSADPNNPSRRGHTRSYEDYKHISNDYEGIEDRLGNMSIEAKKEECFRLGLDPRSCTDDELFRAMKAKM